MRGTARKMMGTMEDGALEYLNLQTFTKPLAPQQGAC